MVFCLFVLRYILAVSLNGLHASASWVLRLREGSTMLGADEFLLSLGCWDSLSYGHCVHKGIIKSFLRLISPLLVIFTALMNLQRGNFPHLYSPVVPGIRPPPWKAGPQTWSHTCSISAFNLASSNSRVQTTKNNCSRLWERERRGWGKSYWLEDNFSIISIYMRVKTTGLKRSLATENKFIQDKRIYVVWERLHV